MATVENCDVIASVKSRICITGQAVTVITVIMHYASEKY